MEKKTSNTHHLHWRKSISWKNEKSVAYARARTHTIRTRAESAINQNENVKCWVSQSQRQRILSHLRLLRRLLFPIFFCSFCSGTLHLHTIARSRIVLSICCAHWTELVVFIGSDFHESHQQTDTHSERSLLLLSRLRTRRVFMLWCPGSPASSISHRICVCVLRVRIFFFRFHFFGFVPFVSNSIHVNFVVETILCVFAAPKSQPSEAQTDCALCWLWFSLHSLPAPLKTNRFVRFNLDGAFVCLSTSNRCRWAKLFQTIYSMCDHQTLLNCVRFYLRIACARSTSVPISNGENKHKQNIFEYNFRLLAIHHREKLKLPPESRFGISIFPGSLQ